MIEFGTTGKQFIEMMRPMVEIAGDNSAFRLVISPDGMESKIVDAGNVAMLHINLPKNIFANWSADEQKEIAIGALDLRTQLGLIKKTDTIEVEIISETIQEKIGREVINSPLKEGEKPEYKDIFREKAVTRMIIITNHSFKKTILLPSPKDARKEPKIPLLPTHAEIKIPQVRFREIIKRANGIGDYIIFLTEMKNGRPIFKTTTPEKNEKTNIEESETTNDMRWCTVTSSKPQVKAIYSIDYLDMFSKIINKDVRIILKYATDYPLQIQFPVCYPKIDFRGGMATFMLAPRVESE